MVFMTAFDDDDPTVSEFDDDEVLDSTVCLSSSAFEYSQQTKAKTRSLF